MSRTRTQGVHHVGLTVPNVKQASSFFINTLAFDLVGEKPEYPAVFLSDGTTMITLWQTQNSETAVAFDRKNVVGLHHLALRVESKEVLDEACRVLKETKDTQIEFEPELLGSGPTRHMMCTIPGGIRMELIAPAT